MSNQGLNKPKQPRDVNKLAFSILEDATLEDRPTLLPSKDTQKNRAAVELGRLGGLKGGKARVEKLSPEERAEIARKATVARWARHRTTI